MMDKKTFAGGTERRRRLSRLRHGGTPLVGSAPQ